MAHFLFIRYHLSTDRYHAKFDRICRVVINLHLDKGSVEYDLEATLPMSAEMRRSFPQVEPAAFLITNQPLIISVHRSGRATPIRFQETESDSIREYVVNESLAHKLGFRNPQAIIGKRMQYYLSPVPLPIVGVVNVA